MKLKYKRILAVDDEPHNLMLLKGFLEADFDCSVDTAASGDDALIKLKSNRYEYDIVISDVTMPGMSGVELLKTVRCDHPTIPFILSSAYAPSKNNEINDLYVSSNLSGFFPKPYLLEGLEAVIQKALDSTEQD